MQITSENCIDFMLSPCFAGCSPIICWKGPVPSHMFCLGYIVCLLLPVLWEELCRFINAWHWNLTSMHYQALMKSVGMSWYTWLPLLWNCSSVFGSVSRAGSLFPVCWYAVESETLHSYRQVSFQFCSGWIYHNYGEALNTSEEIYVGSVETKLYFVRMFNQWMLTILLVYFSPLRVLLSLCRGRQVTLIGILAQMEQPHLIQLMPT